MAPARSRDDRRYRQLECRFRCSLLLEHNLCRNPRDRAPNSFNRNSKLVAARLRQRGSGDHGPGRACALTADLSGSQTYSARLCGGLLTFPQSLAVSCANLSMRPPALLPRDAAALWVGRRIKQ